jgi:hypothetical protein
VEPVSVALAVAVVLVGAIATYLDQPKRLRRSAPRPASYQKISPFLDAEDRAFYDALRPLAESEGLTILAKLRLGDVVESRRDTNRREPNGDVLARTCLDFVLSDAGDLTPVIAVKLDRRVERLPRHREQDQLLDAICHAAGLPLVRANVRIGLAEAEVAARVRARLRALCRLESTLAA